MHMLCKQYVLIVKFHKIKPQKYKEKKAMISTFKYKQYYHFKMYFQTFPPCLYSYILA